MSCNCKNTEGSGEVILVDMQALKKDSNIDINLSENQIMPAVIYVQDVIIERVTGKCLADKLKGLVQENTIKCEENKHYKDLLDHYIFPIFIWGVQASLPVSLTYKARNAGVITVTGENYNPAYLSDIKYVENTYNRKMDFYINRAVEYLKCSDKFPELKACCDGLNKDFAIPLFTGHIRRRRW